MSLTTEPVIAAPVFSSLTSPVTLNFNGGSSKENRSSFPFPFRVELNIPFSSPSSNAIPKSSAKLLIGGFMFSTIQLPSGCSFALKISRPPIPICPSDEKYNVPSSLIYGKSSSPEVLISGPRLTGFDQTSPALSLVDFQISFLPKPPARSETKYNVSPSFDIEGCAATRESGKIPIFFGMLHLSPILFEYIIIQPFFSRFPASQRVKYSSL